MEICEKIAAVVFLFCFYYFLFLFARQFLTPFEGIVCIGLLFSLCVLVNEFGRPPARSAGFFQHWFGYDFGAKDLFESGESPEASAPAPEDIEESDPDDEFPDQPPSYESLYGRK